MTPGGVDIALDLFCVQWMVRSFARWNVSTTLMFFIPLSLYHNVLSWLLSAYGLVRVGMYMFYDILFLFVSFPSDLTPNLCLCWEGTHYSYGYSAVPRIQQCIRFRCCWFFWIHTISYCHTGVPVGICVCASSLCKMGGWNSCYLSLALVLRNASMFWMPFSFIFWKLVCCRNQVHAVSAAEIIAWWSSLAT